MTVNENEFSEYLGLPEYSLNPLEIVRKPGLPATDSGFTFNIIQVLVWGVYSPGYTSTLQQQF